MATEKQPFDPGRYLTEISGRSYLEVKWRLVWLRERHPDAAIETELVKDDGASATFKARVVIPGGGSATGWGQETYNDFADYLEKAETKSLGRALAALGFGTQFSKEFEDGGGSGRSADAPVGGRRGGRNDDPPLTRGMTEGQRRAIYAIARAVNLDIDTFVSTNYGRGVSELTREEASKLIEWLKGQQTAGA